MIVSATAIAAAAVLFVATPRFQLFPFLLKQHLQDQRIDSELSFTSLPRDKVLALQEDPNPPLYACQVSVHPTGLLTFFPFLALGKYYTVVMRSLTFFNTTFFCFIFTRYGDFSKRVPIPGNVVVKKAMFWTRGFSGGGRGDGSPSLSPESSTFSFKTSIHHTELCVGNMSGGMLGGIPLVGKAEEVLLTNIAKFVRFLFFPRYFFCFLAPLCLNIVH